MDISRMTLHRRAVRVRLRGGRFLEGKIHIAEGQALSGFLSSKRFFLNLTEVRWVDATQTDTLPHLSVRLPEIIWAEPLDPALHLSSAILPATDSREVELHLDGGTRLHVRMNVARETRMSDYLDANPAFLPLWSMRVVGRDEVIERVALNHAAIEAIRELEETDPHRRS